MITIIFESHGTTFDNEEGLASGWFDVELSKKGRKEAKELGERHSQEKFDAIFCSDLRRSFVTAEIAFSEKNIPIYKDKRLRECDYGKLSGESSEKIELEKPNRISEPFPNGESYKQASERIRDFLEEILKKYDGKKIMIIGHRATQYGIERWVKGTPLKRIAVSEWKWQPGWTYNFDKIID